MDMLAKAQNWLSAVRKDSLATSRELTFVVKRTGQRICMTNAGVVIGLHGERLDVQGEASALEIEERDYIIPIEALNPHVGGKTQMPVIGDEMHETGTDGRIYRFRVLPQTTEVGFEWHDRERSAVRIHTNFVGVK